MKAEILDNWFGEGINEPVTLVLSRYELGVIYGALYLEAFKTEINHELGFIPQGRHELMKGGIASGRMNQIEKIIGNEAADDAVDRAVFARMRGCTGHPYAGLYWSEEWRKMFFRAVTDDVWVRAEFVYEHGARMQNACRDLMPAVPRYDGSRINS